MLFQACMTFLERRRLAQFSHCSFADSDQRLSRFKEHKSIHAPHPMSSDHVVVLYWGTEPNLNHFQCVAEVYMKRTAVNCSFNIRWMWKAGKCQLSICAISVVLFYVRIIVCVCMYTVLYCIFILTFINNICIACSVCFHLKHLQNGHYLKSYLFSSTPFWRIISIQFDIL